MVRGGLRTAQAQRMLSPAAGVQSIMQAVADGDVHGENAEGDGDAGEDDGGHRPTL